MHVMGRSSRHILQTVGFSSCGANGTEASVQVQAVDIEYNADNKTVSFDVAGTSTEVQNVTAILNVTAYGVQVYSNSFDPFSESTFVEQLCPGELPSCVESVSNLGSWFSSSCRGLLCSGEPGDPGAVRELGARHSFPGPRHRSPGDAAA